MFAFSVVILLAGVAGVNNIQQYSKASFPDTRITATPPCPGGEETAQIVSECINFRYKYKKSKGRIIFRNISQKIKENNIVNRFVCQVQYQWFPIFTSIILQN